MSAGDAGDGEVRREEALIAIGAVLESGVIGERSRLRSLLRYLVQEELDGRGEGLKAYGIGVDVLGRGPDFDPNVDSVVRVEANRLRGLLRTYYETAGARDPVEIVLPPGQYRPTFLLRPAAAKGAATARADVRPAVRPVRRGRRAVAAIVGFALLVAAGLSARMWQEREEQDYVALADAPVIEVGQIRSILQDPALDFMADGVRSLLAADLAHFRTLRVRFKADPASAAVKSLSPADFLVSGYLTRPGDTIRLQLMLVDRRTRELIWSVNRELPSDHGVMRERFVQQVHALVGELASPSGALFAEEIRRLDAQSGTNGDATEYACLLRWHAYDLSKSAADEARARECLTRLTAADSRVGEIWAAYAFLLFLDWTRDPGVDGGALQQTALAAAEKAIRRDPFGAAGHEYRGSILLAMGRRAAARASYEKAISYNPSKPDLRGC